MRKILKDRHAWIIVALILVFAVYTYFQDYGNVSWLPSDETEPLADTVIDLIFYVGIINLGALWFGGRGGLIAVIPAFLTLTWCHSDELTHIDILVYLLFALILGIAIADIISRNISITKSYKKALEEVKTLGGLIPICASCKKIRDDKGYWSAVESYISKHTDAEFSHGICPDCMKKLYPEYDDDDDLSPKG